MSRLCAPGRSPAPTSSPSPPAIRLPDPRASTTPLTPDVPFARHPGSRRQLHPKKLTVVDLVALSGSHSIGIVHCSSFTKRLYPTVDPIMEPAFAMDLKRRCPEPPRGDNLVNNSAMAPPTLGNQYYGNVIANRGLFTTDAALLLARNDTTAKDKANRQNEECCSYTSSNRESWGRCSSFGAVSDGSSSGELPGDPNHKHKIPSFAPKQQSLTLIALATPLRRIRRKPLTVPKERKNRSLWKRLNQERHVMGRA